MSIQQMPMNGIQTTVNQNGQVQFTAYNPNLPMPAPPAYTESIQGQGNYEPPLKEFVDLSGIPSGNILFPHQVAPVQCCSVQKNETGDGHIKSYDPKLDTDSQELFNYFITNLGKPRMSILFHGSHQETRVRTTHVNGQMRTEHHTVTVTDFSFEIDVSNLIGDQWLRLVCMQDGDKPAAWKDVLDSYTLSRNKLKEIHMHKQPLWEYNDLRCSLESCVRATGYTGSVSIQFITRSDKVSAYSSDTISKVAHNKIVKVLCVLSCLCIIFAPIYYSMRKKVDKIICEYKVNMPGQEFYYRNYNMIQYYVRSMAKGQTFSSC